MEVFLGERSLNDTARLAMHGNYPYSQGQKQCHDATAVGFYSLAAASILLDALPEATVRKMPRYPSVPAIRLGRLAVTQERQGRHVGSLLVWDAMQRCCRKDLAWAVPLVDAKSDRLAAFYEKFLFRRVADGKCSLWLSQRQVEHMLAG